MSEFIAEAQVLVRPNTAAFRTELLAQLGAIQRSIPPIKIPIIGFDQAALTRGAAGVTTSATSAAEAVTGETTAVSRLGRVSLETSGAQRTLAASQTAVSVASKNAERGVLSQTLGLAGLRGAVLGANSAFLIGATGALTFFKSLQLAANLEQDLATFRVTTEATADELTRVAETARALGRDIRLPGVSASDAAESMLALAKAGLSVQESIDGARGSLQLATAAEIDNASAAVLVANALNAFGLAGSKAVDIADLLANAANASQGSIEDMGIALRQSAAVANQLGLSAQDTVVFLTQLAKAGLAGSDAGTTLRVALTRLVAPTAAAAEQIEKLQLDLRDAQGNLRTDIFVQLGTALQGLNRAAQDRALKDIFGENAQRVAAILSRQGLPALRATQDALRKEGTAADVAAAKNEGLAGSVENAKNQFSAFALEIGQMAAPLASLGLDATALLFGALADELHDIHEAWKQQISDLEQIGNALKSLSDESGFSDFVKTVDEGGDAFQDDFERAGQAVADFTKDLFGLSSATASVDPPVVTLTKSLEGYIDAGERAGAATLALAGDMDALARATTQAATPQAKLGLEIEAARAGGNDQDLVSLLEEREQNLQAFIDRLNKREQTKAVVATLTKANQDLDAVRAEIDSILSQQASDNERAARDIQSARDKADQSFLDMLSGKRDTRERFITQAEGTESLKDDIRLRVRFINLLEQQIKNARKTIQDAKLRAATIASLTSQIVQVGNEIKRLRQEQRQALRDAAQERQERLERSIQLDIDLADTNENQKRQISLRLKLIAQIRREIKVLHLQGNALKEKRNEIARINKEIEDLRKEDEEAQNKGKSFARMTFEFLQTQQGFAANLLGNLIPSGATGGLVGNVSSSGRGPADIGAEPQQRVDASAAVGAARERGVRPGQVETTNALLRRILRSLENLNGRAGHPEARYQHATGSSNFDTM